MKENNKYEPLEISVIEFEETDIVTASCVPDEDGNGLPDFANT